MKLRQSSALNMVLGIFFALVCALSIARPSAAVSAAGPDWLSGALTVENIQTITPTAEELSVISSGNQLVCITAKSWSGLNGYFGVTPIEENSRGCGVPMTTGYMADHMYLAYGNKYWQPLEYDRDGSIVPVPGASGAVVVDGDYPRLKLHYVNDLLGMYRHFTKDNVGNIIRSRSSSTYDFTLKQADGQDMSVEGPLSFSANGRWLYLLNTAKSQMLLNIDTKQTLVFALYQRSFYVRAVSVSNSGRFVATSERYMGFLVYDMDQCDTDQPDDTSRTCAKRDLEADVRDAYIKTLPDSQNFASLSVVAVQFKTESTLAVTASVAMRDGTGEYVSFDVRVDPGPRTTRYLALGDSFSSGEGVGNYYEATNFTADASNFNECHQSRQAYSEILNKTLTPDWYDSVACSGAQIKDISYVDDDLSYIYNRNSRPQAKAPNEDSDFLKSVTASLTPGYIPQLSLLKANPSTVSTITIGGNDIGFGDIVTSCVWQAGCYFTRDSRESLADLVKRQIPRLVSVYQAIKQNMSGSDPHVYVIGYPKIFNQDNLCASYMSERERVFANSLVDYLNGAIKAAANEANVRYIDVSDAFIDYQSGKDFRLCGNAAQAVNGLALDTKNASDAQGLNQYFTSSYHPNALGHKLLAARIRSYTNDFKLSMPSSAVSVDGPSVDLYRQLVGDTEDKLADITQINLDVVEGSVFKKGDSLDVSFKSDSREVPITEDGITVELHSEPVTLATLKLGSDGTVSAHIPLPADILPGPHEIHLLYTDIAGQKHDIYKHVYVLGSLTDFDGDGVPNDQELCVIGGTLGVDKDHDGRDDACDSTVVENEAVAVSQGTVDKQEDNNSSLKPLLSDDLENPISSNPLQSQSKPDLNNSLVWPLAVSGIATATLGAPSNYGIEGWTDNTSDGNLPSSVAGVTKTAARERKEEKTTSPDSVLLLVGAAVCTVVAVTVLVLKRKHISKSEIER